MSPIIIELILFVWTVTLTFLFIWFYIKYANFSKKGKSDSLLGMLEELNKTQNNHEKMLETITAKCDTLEKEGQLHIQKVGLVRFNPFKDTGGDQSFILALVDAQDTGVVISSLHTRTGTRWYAKQVLRGKGSEHELSDEEAKALKQARVLKE